MDFFSLDWSPSILSHCRLVKFVGEGLSLNEASSLDTASK